VTCADGRAVAEFSVRIGDYLGTPAVKGIGMLGEPEPHWYFDRPLHLLFRNRFYPVRVVTGEIRPEGLDAIERGVYRGHRWWRLDGFESPAETVYTARLADLLLGHVGRPALDCA
jgi:hypothetical protein